MAKVSGDHVRLLYVCTRWGKTNRKIILSSRIKWKETHIDEGISKQKWEKSEEKINHTRFNNKQLVWIGDKIPQNPARGSAAIIFSYGRADRNGKRKIIGLKQVSKLNSIALEEKETNWKNSLIQSLIVATVRFSIRIFKKKPKRTISKLQTASLVILFHKRVVHPHRSVRSFQFTNR